MARIKINKNMELFARNKENHGITSKRKARTPPNQDLNIKNNKDLMVHENKGNPRNYLREKEQSTTKRGSCDQEDDGDEEEKYLLLDQIERAWIVRPTKP